jgi:carbon-monoxide dehydrogenase medium subunit
MQARIALTGVGATAMRAKDAEALLNGRPLDPEALNGVMDAVRESVEPNTDLHASADYRRHLVGVLARRAVDAAWRRAQPEAA